MAPRIPSLNWLRVFEAAARTGSFARAADALNMSPPAVSQQIKALEAALGRPLFERSARSVALTDAGRQFLPTVVRSLHSVEAASASIFGDVSTQSLTVQASLLLAVGWLAPRLARFNAAHPDIRVTLTSAIHDAEFNDLADLRIVFGLPERPFEQRDAMFGELIQPVAPPDIAEAVKRPEDLLDYPLVEIATHRANWWSFLPRSGAKPRFVMVDSSLTAFAAAEHGAIALARAPACGEMPARHGLVPCPAFPPVPGLQDYALVHRGVTGLSPAAAVFREWVLQEAQRAV